MKTKGKEQAGHGGKESISKVWVRDRILLSKIFLKKLSFKIHIHSLICGKK